MKFKLPSSYTILFMIIVVIAILTWIIPAGEYEKSGRVLISGTYHRVEQNPQGLFEVFIAPINGFLGTKSTGGAAEIAVFILMIGGFLGIVNKTGTMDAGIASIVKNSKGNAKRLIPILVFVTALGGTTFGLAEETIAFFPLVLPIMLATGLDPIVGVASIMLGAKLGTLASTINPFATGVASAAIGISPGEGIGWRLLLFVTNIGLTTWYIYRYASKVEKNPANSFMASTLEEERKLWHKDMETTVMTKEQKKVLYLFTFTFLLMIVSLIPWDVINKNWTFFNTFNNWLRGVPVLGTFLGHIPPLGTWYFREISMLMLIMAVIIGIVYKLKESEIVSGFVNGARDLLGVALIVGLARGIQVIMNDGHMTATVLHWGEGVLSGISPALFGVLTYLFYIPMSFLIPSTSGLASATMSITGGLAEFANVAPHVVVTAFQTASGLVNAITPTSGVLMAGLAIGRINYGIWLKFVFKLILALFLLDMVIIAVAAVVS